MKFDSWANHSGYERDPAQIAEIMRCPAMLISPIDPYLQNVEAAAGCDLSALRAATRNALVYQPATEHLATRRLIAGFFSERGIAPWQPLIDQAVEESLSTLETATEPDLMAHFVTPLFLRVMSRLVGFKDDGTGRLFPMIVEAQRMTEPMLSLKELRSLDSAIRYLLEVLPALPEAPVEDPECLLAYLHRRREHAPPGVDLRQSALVLLLAANTVGQTIGFALLGLLTGDAGEWRGLADGAMEDEVLDRLLSLYLPTITLVRAPESDIEIGGCPYSMNRPAVLDIVTANARLRVLRESGERTVPHLSFGSGPHKCPGEALSRRLVRSALPALARRFPWLALHKDRVRAFATPMVQAPTSLPCELLGQNCRRSARLVEVKEYAAGLAVVGDNATFAPPQMEAFLETLTSEAGLPLTAARRAARNALFFMSGPRHITARRAIARVLGRNPVRQWQSRISQDVSAALGALEGQQTADLVSDFADPLGLGVAHRVLGVELTDADRFHELSPQLQLLQEPWLPRRQLLALETTIEELLSLMRLPEPEASHEASLLVSLQEAELDDFDTEDIKALTLILYGASFNLAHTLANALHWLLGRPLEEHAAAACPQWLSDNLERLIAHCASPKYIYRMAREPCRVGDIAVQRNDTVRLQLLSVNRGLANDHLAFGNGLHHCVGASLSRMVISEAVPAFFARFPEASLVPQAHRYLELSQTIALRSLPCRLTPRPPIQP